MANLFHKTITVLALGSVLILEGTTSLYAQKKELSNDIIWGKPQFSAKAISGLRSMNDGKHYSSFYTNPDTKATYILAYEYATGKVTDTILKSSELKIMIGNDVQKIQMDNYEFSGDETKILISNSSEGIYRHSSKELNYIFDRKTRRLQNLSDFGKQMFASFSPNGDKVAFVRDNNIFVRDVATREEVKVTDDGEWEHIINGWCDWVYEEEFGYAPAFQWSPDGKNIAFYKFDESAVKRFNMAMYGELYPKDYQYKYPDVIQQTEESYPQMTEEFWKICHEQYETFCLKNSNYGTGNVAVGTSLSTPDDVQLSLTGLFFRINDKVQRFKQLVVLGKKDTVGEAIDDTFQDLSVYGIIAQLVKRGKWAK